MILFIVWKEYWKAIKRLEKKYQQCLGDMLSLMGVSTFQRTNENKNFINTLISMSTYNILTYR